MLPDDQERIERQLALLKRQIAQRKEAEEGLRRESAIVKLLQEVAVAANEARALEEVFEEALDKICDFTGWPLGRVFLVDKDSGDLILTSIFYCSDHAQYSPFLERTIETLSRANIEWLANVVSTGEPQWFKDVAHHPAFIPERSLQESGVKTGLAFPVLVGAEVVAVMEFFSLEEEQPDEDLLRAMTHIGAQLGRVAERMRAEETLRESEQRLRQSRTLLAEAERIAQMGSWEWDVKKNEVTWSEGLYRVYGLKPGELANSFEGFLKHVHPDDRTYTRELVETAYANQQAFEFFHRIVRPDGEVRLLHGRGQPVFDDAGELIQMVGTGQDVTDLKQTEARLEQSAQQLSALNELGQTITSSLDLQDVFQRVLGSLRPLLKAEGIFILLLEGDHLVFAATDEVGIGSLQGQRVPLTGGVAGEVIDTGRPIWVYGETTRQRVYRHIEEKTGYKPAALLATPLRLRGEWIGVIEAIHSQADAFDAGDLRLLEAAAAWTSIAIGNARLFEGQQRARQTAEVMRNANQDLTRTLDVGAVLDSLLEHLQLLVGYDRAVVMLQELGAQLRVRAIRGCDDAGRLLYARTPSDSHPLFLHLLDTRETLLVADAAGAMSCEPLPDFAGTAGSQMAIPVRVSGQVIGFCLLENTERGRYTRQQQLHAESLVGQAATALQNARLFTEIRASRERLRYLTGKVVSAQEEERRRVSRELHDQAGQALTVLKISLSTIGAALPDELENPRELLSEALDLTDQTMEQIRLLAHDLRPPVLDTFSLNEALEGLCQEFTGRGELSVKYRGEELPSLPDTVAISFYRFLQEALTNVTKHAGATEVQVVLEATEGTIELSVTDDGQGFTMGPDTSSRRGIGLIGAQERFELLGGQLSIKSTPGRGTRLTARAPLDPNQKENKGR